MATEPLTQGETIAGMQIPDFLRHVFDAGVAACQPDRVLRPALPARPRGKIVVTGSGKAAAAMAQTVEAAWGDELEGTVVTRYGHSVPTKSVRVLQAGHPYPDALSFEAARDALARSSHLTDGDTLVVLLSGGGSALWTLPLGEISLQEKRDVTRSLLSCGAPIDEINCVRKHLSGVKGGRLAAHAFPANTITFAISDVASDDVSVIASGPTTGDPTTQRDALSILAKYSIAIPKSVNEVLANPIFESVKPGDARLERSELQIVACGSDALAAACDAAHASGVDARILGVRIEGDARSVGLAHGHLIRGMDNPTRPLLLISGGELTVSVTGQGAGGPNREYLVSLAKSLAGMAGVWALAGDTDGIDGSDEIAGGWISPRSYQRARDLGARAEDCLANNDSARFFRSLSQEINTGPTLTNVNDLRVILLMPDAEALRLSNS